MNMRYYLVTIQHNRLSDAENRTAPKAYNTIDEAIAAFHKQMATDMSNETLDWAISIVFDNIGGIHRNERWEIKEIEELFENPTE